jgi:hypothetical protein
MADASKCRRTLPATWREGKKGSGYLFAIALDTQSGLSDIFSTTADRR